jgi:prolyl-tRNA editing enzyme YbaK/EbsC (Cys-tRNA(Pro) deacylase)
VKSLVFTSADGAVLALTSGANRVDTTALGRLAGSAIKRADADAAKAATGYAIGGTPPFGHASPIPTYVDRDLLDHEVVWAAAGVPDSVFPIEPERLVEVTGGIVADFASV